MVYGAQGAGRLELGGCLVGIQTTPKSSTPNPGMGLRHNGVWGLGFRVLVEGFNLSCHNQETIFFTIDPYYGDLNLNPRTRTQYLHVDAPSQCAGTTNLAPKTAAKPEMPHPKALNSERNPKPPNLTGNLTYTNSQTNSPRTHIGDSNPGPKP